LKLGYKFTTYGKLTETSGIDELQIRKPLSPIWIHSSISRKQQAMGFEPSSKYGSKPKNEHNDDAETDLLESKSSSDSDEEPELSNVVKKH